MKYDFDQIIAKQVWVEEAILYSNICWWCEKNEADRSEKHYKEGMYWTYSSERAWSELFPFWTARQISRMVNNLEKSELILSENYGGNDRTKWYAPLTRTVQCKRPNSPLQKTKRSNDIYNTDNNPDNNPDIQKDFDSFWILYPNKKDKETTEKKFSKLSEKDRKNVMDILPIHIIYWKTKYGTPGEEKFLLTYVPYPSTWINKRRWEDILEPVIIKQEKTARNALTSSPDYSSGVSRFQKLWS